jgi:hypothetical protein
MESEQLFVPIIGKILPTFVNCSRKCSNFFRLASGFAYMRQADRVDPAAIVVSI